MFDFLVDILPWFLERIGLDLRKMSTLRAIFVLTFYYLSGSILLVGGLYYLLNNLEDGLSILIGSICALIGVAYVTRITLNLIARLKQGRS